MIAAPVPDIRWEAPRCILNGILTNLGMSSRLFQELRVKRNLLYHIHAYHRVFSPTMGAWGIETTLRSTSYADQVLSVITNVMTDPQTFDPALVATVKQALIGELNMADHYPRKTLNQVDEHFCYYRRIKPESEYRQEIEAVTPEDVIRASQLVGPNNWLIITFIPPS